MTMHPIQIEIFKKMSAEKKFELAARLYHGAKEIKKAALKEKYPDWSAKKVDQAVRDIFIYGTIRNI